MSADAPPASRARRHRRLDQLAGLLASQPGQIGSNELTAFQQLALSGLDYKGQLSSGYGETGWGLGVGVVFNLGDLVCPGVVSIPVGVEGKGTWARRTMLALYRMPRGTTPANERPTGFYYMVGHRVRFALKGKATVKIGAVWKSKDDDPGFVIDHDFAFIDEIGAYGKLDVDAGGEVDLVNLMDVAPRFFPAEAFSEELGTAVGEAIQLDLKSRVELALERARRRASFAEKAGGKAKRTLRDQFANALNTLLGEGVQKEKPGMGADGESGTKPVVVDIAPLVDRFWRSRRRSTKELVEALQKLRSVTMNAPVHAGVSRALHTRQVVKELADLDDLILQLERAKKLKTARSGEILDIQFAHLEGKISAYERDKRLAPLLRPSKADATVVRGALAKVPLTLLTAATFRADAGTSLGAGVKVKKENSQIGASGFGSYRRDYARSSYRFQTISDAGEHPVVMTQDTRMTRRQRDLTADLQLGVVGAPMDEPINPEETAPTVFAGTKKLYNTASYESMVVYWRYADLDRARSLPIGSGLSFGLSVNVSRFVAWRKMQADARSGDPLHKLMARQLRLPNEALHAFAAECWIDTSLKEKGNGGIHTVLIESSYAFHDAVEFPLRQAVKAPRGQTRSDHVRRPESLLARPELTGFETPTSLDAARSGRVRLDSIRVRTTLGGAFDRSQKVFHLGFTYVLGMSAAYEDARSAGVEAGVDLYVWHPEPAPDPAPAANDEGGATSLSTATQERLSGRPAPADGPEDGAVAELESTARSWKPDPREAAERAVPPVALLFS